MVLFGFLGYALKRNKFPLAPLVVGFILAPSLETYLRRSLMKSEGSFLPFVQSPIATVFLILTVLAVGYTVYGEIKKTQRQVRGN
jgi:putative tricarboxylic transport membrane protein